MKKFVLLLMLMLIVGAVLGCSSQQAEEKEVTIGGKAGTEAYVLANLAKELLEAEGFKVETELGVKSVLARQALEQEEVDLYYEYTGTAYTVYHEQADEEIMTDSQAVYDWVKNKDDEQGLIWLDKLNYNNTYTIMLQEEKAEEWGVESLSDLAAKDDKLELTFGTDAEFYERPDGLQALMEEYNLEFEEVKKMSAGIVYNALKEGKIDSGMGYSTDGRIDAFGFVNLTDDKNFFPVYNPAPVIREEVLNQYPEIRDILAPLTEKLTTNIMQELNGRVDVDKEDPEAVARDWLESNGLL
jgi:osmoprotectant transport system substrate-binding protein